MSCCQRNGRKSSNGRNVSTVSNCCNTSLPSCKKANRQTRKKCTNQRVFSNEESHYSKASNDICDQPLENCSQNLKNKHVSINLHEPLKTETCKRHRKNNKLYAAYNYLLTGKQCECLPCKDCSIDQKYCTDSTENSEEAAELKTSISDTKHCLNNTNIIDEAAQSNISVPHTDCKYCHCHTNNKRITKSKSLIPHTECKYCRNNTDNIEGVTKSKSSVLPHTDCKYCQNNINNKGEVKSKNPLPHTDCKYCLSNNNNFEELTASDVSSECTDSISLEELSDELLNLYSTTEHMYVPCSLHDPCAILDPLHLHQPYCQIHQGRPAPYTCSLCEFPEFCLVNNDTTFHIREIATEQCSQSLQELNFRNSMDKSTNCKSCEFCLRNGETPVIYNSHQLRNAFGTITCPILRQNICHGCEITKNLGSCPRNYDELIAPINTIHANNSVSHVGMPFRETIDGCVSCSLLDGLQNISSSDLYSSLSSLEKPHPYSFYNKSNSQGSKGSYSNLYGGFCSTEKGHDSKCVSDLSVKVPTCNQYDTKISLSKHNQNYISKMQQMNNSANIRKSKKGVCCQFCLTTGKPPYIYNSHELRDESGANLKCPILKAHVNEATGSGAHICSGSSHNIFEREMHFPLVKGISNGSLSKCQYFDLTNCLW